MLKAGFNVKRVAVGDPTIADVIVLNTREIHLVAKSIGDTNVIVWDSKGALQAAIDLSVGTPHSQIEAELGRVLENSSIRVDAAGEAVLLKGTVASPTELQQAMQVAEAFFGCRGGCDDDENDDRVISMLEVGGNQQVMLDIKLAEMSRSLRRNLGTNWAGTDIGGNSTVNLFSFLQNLTSLDSTAAGEIFTLTQNVNLVARITDGSDQLDLFIQAVQEDGLAKILAEPTVVARSGEPAEFLVGGEVPIPVPQSGAFGVVTIEYKQFGVGVTFTPTVMGEERIHLQVSTEVSEPDLSLGAQLEGFVVPAFTTRRASTGVELGDGQSFAIAGLLRDDVVELAHKFPFIGDVPILGALFSSTQFEKRETELVMIVTPHLVKPLPKGDIPLPTDHFVEPNAFEYFFLGELEGNVFDRKLRSPKDGLAGLFESIRPAKDEQIDTELALDGTPIPSSSIEIDPWTGDSIAGDAGHRVSISEVEGAL